MHVPPTVSRLCASLREMDSWIIGPSEPLGCMPHSASVALGTYCGKEGHDRRTPPRQLHGAISRPPMRLPQKLIEPHQRNFRQTYEKIFRPSPSEPLEWREVRSLFREIGQVAWQANGDLKVTRRGHVLILRPPPTRDVSGPDELLELQRFLERSEGTMSALDGHELPERAVLPP